MSWATPPGPVLKDGEDPVSLKLELAKYMANGKTVREAAYMVFRKDTDENTGQRYFGRALQAMAWEADPIVQEEIERLRVDIATNEDEQPTDAELVNVLWQTAKSARQDGKYKEAVDAAAKIMEARGTIKRGTNVNVDARSVVYNPATVIPAKMTVEEWREAAANRKAERLALTHVR